MSVLRYGIIGCGVIHDAHVKAIQAIPEYAKLVAVCDSDPAALAMAVEATGARGYSNVEEFLRDPEIHVVTVCTPSGLHADHSIAALDAGKHVISEKPMDILLPKADAMIAAAGRNHKQLAVISQTRYTPGFQILHEWLDAGKFGKLIHGTSQLLYYRSQEYYDSAGWRGTWALDGGGALMNQGVHYVDQLIWAMGRPKSVYARVGQLGHERIEVEDIASATIEFESGALGTLMATTCAYPGHGGAIEVIGTGGTARVCDGKVIYAEFVGGSRYNSANDGQDTKGADPRFGGSSEHERQVRDITLAILEGRDPEITMYDGRNALELVLAVYESARTGAVVTL